MLLTDNVVTGEKTLHKLANAIHGKDVDETGLVDGYVLRYDLSSQTWKTVKRQAGLSQQLHIGFYNDTFPNSWTRAGGFLFGGTDSVGTLIAVSTVSHQNGGGGRSHALRVYDADNGLVIATVTGLTNTTPAQVDLGAISNLPTASAVWEIQVMREGLNDSGSIYSIILEF